MTGTRALRGTRPAGVLSGLSPPCPAPRVGLAHLRACFPGGLVGEGRRPPLGRGPGEKQGGVAEKLGGEEPGLAGQDMVGELRVH